MPRSNRITDNYALTDCETSGDLIRFGIGFGAETLHCIANMSADSAKANVSLALGFLSTQHATLVHRHGAGETSVKPQH